MASEILRYPVSGSVNNSNENKNQRTIIKFYEYKRYRSNEENLNSTGTITLPLPRNFVDGNSIQSNAGSGVFANVVAGSEQFRNPTEILRGLYSAGEAIENIDRDYIVKAAQAFIPGLSLAAGQIFNPQTTLFFEGVDLKSHQLEWKFSPFSREDITQLKDIERSIKEKIYPKKEGIFLKYPNLCTVRFRNVELPPIRRSFVTNFNMNFGSGEQISLYEVENSNAYPIIVNISMSLTEIEIRTSENSSNQSLSDESSLIKSDSILANEPSN